MYRILLADDEGIMLESLKKIIPPEALQKVPETEELRQLCL